jgi:hypothetical protein
MEQENKPTEQIVQDQTAATPVATTEIKEDAPKSSQQWDNFRQARAAERKKAEEIAKQAEKSAQEAAALRAAMDSLLNKNQPQQHSRGYDNSQSDQNEETEDQRIDKRVAEAIAKKEAEYEQKRRDREQQEYPQRLNNTFNDFNQVCTSDNLDYLEYHYPEVAQAFKYAPEGFDKWASIYKAVKRFVPNTDSKKEAAKAEKNFAKPGSISSPTVAQGSQNPPSSRVDDERKAANWARMQKALKQIG